MRDPFGTTRASVRRGSAEAENQALTVALPPRDVAMTTGGATAVRVALVEGSGPHLASETQTLRHARLRAAAIFLFIAVGVFLIWRLAFGAVRELWVLDVVVMSGLGAMLTLLSDPRPIPPRRLKAIELGTFGLMAALLSIRQYVGMVAAGSGGGVTLLAVARGSLIGSLILMFAYAMLIPNTWRAAAKVVLAIASMPVATQAVVFVSHPWVMRSIREATTVELMTENCLFTLIASALSIYGTHVINELRVEVFVARQLNQYRLLRLLGSGGMGDVYLAEHRMMKRPCALKLIRADRAADPGSIVRFEREVRATARLSHPNTVEIYDYGRSDDGTFYYVMEYLPGLSLQDIIDDHGPMPPGRAIYLLRQACGALAEAHGSGLIHRDLKPANIIASRRGGLDDVAKILDFGLVKDVSPLTGANASTTAEHTVQGTPLYMAPEQAFGRSEIDHRIDLYALGGVAYLLVTGRPPFERPSRVGLMAAHAHDPIVPPRVIAPEVPDDLERVIVRCLAKNPDDRYPDAESLADALGACSAAADWDAHRAGDWWRRFEPDAVHEPGPNGDLAVTSESTPRGGTVAPPTNGVSQ